MASIHKLEDRFRAAAEFQRRIAELTALGVALLHGDPSGKASRTAKAVYGKASRGSVHKSERNISTPGIADTLCSGKKGKDL